MKRWLKVVLIVVFIVVLAVGIWWWSRRPSGLKEKAVVNEVKQEEAKELKFGVMADIHSDTTHLERALIKAKEDGLELVIVAGDLTKVGKVEELRVVKEVLDQSGMEYYAIPGNHDKNIGTFKELFGDNYRSFRKGEYKFILIDNSSWRGLGVEQRRWLEAEVGECRIIYCLVIMHMPLNNGFSEHVMGEDNEKVTAEAKELVVLLRDNGVKEIMAGHLHYASSYELEGIRTSLVGAINGFQFSEFGASESGIRREVKEIN